jgi:mycoredoxin
MAMMSAVRPVPLAPRRTATEVVIYGRRWCALSQMLRRHLNRLSVPYEYVDLDLHPEVEGRLEWLTGGRVHSPLVSIGGRLLVQPTNSEVEWALARAGVI